MSIENNMLLKCYRSLPWFKGKLRLGKLLFSSLVETDGDLRFTAHDGLLFTVPDTKENIGLELAINGVYEHDIVSFLKKNVHDGDVFFDIGANLGSIGLPLAKLKDDLKYYGFEPSPITFRYLEQNFAANNIAGSHLYNRAVHNATSSSLPFYVSAFHGKSSFTCDKTSTLIQVPAVSLDAFCRGENIPQIDWMKVDVQGHELFVFEGMRELLARKAVRNILFEFESWAETTAGLPAGAAQQFLIDAGYELFNIQGKQWANDGAGKDSMILAKPNNPNNVAG